MKNTKKIVTIILIFGYLQLFCEQCNAENKKNEVPVAIIIDDFGNKLGGTKEMMNLNIPITVAVMPFLSSTKKDAAWAEKLGHDVLIHMPMEPVNGKASWLGPKAITTDLSDSEIKKRLEAAYKEIPNAVGINNHMGSKVLSNKRVMRIVLTFCQENDLFFIDSATTSNSVVKEIAEELGDIIFLKNDIFLDSIHNSEHINKQLTAISMLAKKQNDVIAIGHVGINGLITANALTNLKEKEHTSIPPLKFVKITDLIENRTE